MIDNKTIVDGHNCTGCCACFNVCPKNCINMVENRYGEIVPQINQEYCIECGLCKKICPQMQPIDFKFPKKVLAAWSFEYRKESSSGGIAHELSIYFVENNGIVIGCEYDINKNLVHHIAKNMEELNNFKGSKYSQSYIGNTYKLVKENLLKEKKVLFIGTPCQIQGLRKYLQEKEYSNLYTVDLICHGVPPNKYLKEYVKHLENQIGEESEELTFRGRNEKEYKFTLYSKGNKVYQKVADEDLYYKGFLKGLFNRECCYECKYAQLGRTGDITLGDFWGLGKDKEFRQSLEDGVSLVMLNNNKGIALLDCIKSKIFMEEREISEAIGGNAQLRNSIQKPNSYHKFRETYKNEGFIQAINKIVNGGKMKIGILTMQRVKNYGSFLLALSLKNIMENLGGTVEFIDIKPGKIYEGTQYTDRGEKDWNNKEFVDIRKGREEIIEQYAKKYLNVTGEMNYSSQYDMGIIGSDEVFNCIGNGNIGFTSQLFGKDVSNYTITYAASAGHTTLEQIEQNNISNEIIDALSNVRKISVRDKNTYNIIKQLTDTEPTANIDPVLLSDFNEYKAEIKMPQEDYIIIYSYDYRLCKKEEVEKIQAFAKKNKLKTIAVGLYQPWCDEKINVTPFELLEYFKNAKYIITDTFHGLIFSIKYNKEFVGISRESNKNKFNDLLERFHLNYRNIKDLEHLEETFNTPINYELTNSIIAEEKNRGLQFLKEQFHQAELKKRGM